MIKTKKIMYYVQKKNKIKILNLCDLPEEGIE